jgi:hypothetical protein
MSPELGGPAGRTGTAECGTERTKVMTAIQEIHETTSAGITVTPVAGHIGAHISGVDIAEPLAPEQFGEPFTTKHTVVVAD